jgi:hypothetical protein
MGPEAKIQKNVVDFARKTFGDRLIARKFAVGRSFTGAPTGETGWPDFEFIVKTAGRPYVFMIEFKSPGGKLTPKQSHMIDRLADVGVPTFVVDDAKQGRLVITDQLRKAARLKEAA